MTPQAEVGSREERERERELGRERGESKWGRKGNCGMIQLSSTPSTMPCPSTRSSLLLSILFTFFFEFYSLLLIFTFLILQKMHGKKRIQDKSTDGGKFGGGTEDENASAITRVVESLDGTVK
jgi:hypothetical protein